MTKLWRFTFESRRNCDVPILPATFVQNSQIVMESEILTPLSAASREETRAKDRGDGPQGSNLGRHL